MSRDTLIILCNELKPHLERRKTKFRNPVSVEVRVAVTIWRLGTNWNFALAELFGLGRSTVGEIVLDKCDAITSHLFQLYVYVPQMQAAVELRGLFIDINIGWPGKVHDACVLVNSTFFRKGKQWESVS